MNRYQFSFQEWDDLQSSLPCKVKRNYRVKLVNHIQETAQGRLSVAREPDRDGRPLQAETSFTVAPVGTSDRAPELAAPSGTGEHLLVATAFWDGKPWSPTISLRKVTIVATDPALE